MVLIAIKQQLIYSVRINKLSRLGGGVGVHPHYRLALTSTLTETAIIIGNKIYKIYLITIIFKILHKKINKNKI